ncbi:hypothetical protein K474DRAFT_1591843 [Panus rudis PR-1116 ss-1]|nr:hypothetical protein K474DRAFT_1591843 [Panus rudis PR-1116 ss-1]
MRQKRAKAYRKLMSLYSMSFGFRQPYQVLIDSEMCKSAISGKIDFVKQLSTVLQGDVKPMITQCCIHELYLQGKAQQPAVDLAKTFERRKCNHREAIPGDECLTSVVGDTNKHRYVIATQSSPLRVKLRTVPAVPIVHINRAVMILEPPSDTTLRAKELMEQQALGPSMAEKSRIEADKPPVQPPKKKKGPKGPNPLSVKKKKPKATLPEKQSAESDEKHARTGEKRKQGHESDSEDGNTPANVTEGSGHKRKRRRRKSAQIAGSISSQENA